MTWVGIDPGDNTGLAVWDRSAQAFEMVLTLPLHRALEMVRDLHTIYKDNLIVVFEDARQRKWFKPETSTSEYRGRLMGAGAAKRDAKIWEEFLTDLRITFEAHKPQAGGTKWSADYFAKITGYTGRTSEHARDAALLVYGRR